MVKLRVHHLFDIIRDYGINKEIEKHKYGHSYHIIANEIYKKNIQEIEIVGSSDDVCINCIKLMNNRCIDKIDHREDYHDKELFNNYLDKRIMDIMDLKESEILSIEKLVKRSNKYIDNIEYIYKGNEEKHTQERKINVQKGLNKIKNGYYDTD